MGNGVYVGLFLVTLATLSFEILLTRIFSVTMWYHFAFVAISVAMFGMTVGAIVVYLFPRHFTEDRAGRQLASSSLMFSLAIIVSFLTQLSIPFVPGQSIAGVNSLVFTYLVVAVPFVFSGVCVCLALTKFPGHVSRLYAFDLAGGAMGCVLLIYMLRITDAPTAVIVIAAFASLGSFFFTFGQRSNGLRIIAFLTTVVLVCFSIINTILVAQQSSLLRITWVRGSYEARPLYEKWNSFSRVAVWGDPNVPRCPEVQGLSPVYQRGEIIKQLHVDIDANASTVMTAFNGDLSGLEYLKYDITNFAHYIRPDSKVLVIGTGGGRDILSALVFQQQSVLGIEINEDIIKILNKQFGDFSGHLDQRPNVHFVNDEARSYIARTKSRFDIIQASFIDTWAATSAGAFVLTENSLYTIEAWKIFLHHLTPRGVLTFSRWYYRNLPGEMYRLTSLASASLMDSGIKNPRGHIVIVRRMFGIKQDAPLGAGTMLVSREPFSDQDIEVVEKMARDLQFEIMLTPHYAADKTFEAIASGRALDTITSKFPINIAATVDDSPFFFHMLRLCNILDWKSLGVGEANANAVFVLVMLLLTVTGLSVLCIIIPLLLTTQKTTLKGALPFFVFFMAIGFGFMLVEISQMQRLIVFLGHPVYGLSVVLFSLLLSSGVGSYSTRKINDLQVERSAFVRLSILLTILCLFGIVSRSVLSMFEASPNEWRIILSVGMLFVLGFLMGMPFPLGMRLAFMRSAAIAPWLWGINGATSVCASVLAIIIAISLGISTTFWVGFACYFIALIALGGMTLKRPASN
ncbi:MAG: Spermidine synthase [Smithella sp. PtaU1.Bin162]|nr:MAG: Spermidine synthase [Smithella sp. PtaU1.Bin162]